MNVTFRQLKLFLAFAEHGGVTAAARASHVTQPTVSMQLRELAEEVGVPLYEQVGKQIHLTQAGEWLADSVRTINGEWENFKQHIAALKGVEEGRLQISVVSTAKYFIPKILGGFCKQHPNIDIALQVLNRDGVVARLRDNRDDIYIMSMPPEDIPIVSQYFLSNPLVLVAPLNHPLSRRQSIRTEVLRNERFILREKGSGTRLACDAHFRKIGFNPLVRLELGSNEAIKQSVSAEMGISVISRHAIARHPSSEGLCILPVRGFPLHSKWSIIYLHGKNPSPIVQAFLPHLMAAAGKIQERL